MLVYRRIVRSIVVAIVLVGLTALHTSYLATRPALTGTMVTRVEKQPGAPPLAAPPQLAAPPRVAHKSVVKALDRHSDADYNFLAAWPAEKLRSLQVWLDHEIAFAGDWSSEELEEVVSVLNAYATVYGQARFFELIDAAQGLRSDRQGPHLTIVKAPGESMPAAAWRPRSGEMVLKAGLFDDLFVDRYYHWSFLYSPYARPDDGLGFREVVIAHELGHVVTYGLRAEAAAAGHSRFSLEGVYARTVPVYQRPHREATTEESVATEIGVWALGVGRTPEVDAFRANFLAATIVGSNWADSTAFAATYDAR